MAADNYRFTKSDSLLCYYEKMLYEAKCLKRRKANDGKAQYFIHYKGWNSTWEEWVDDDRVLPVNAANMNKMASLKEIHSNTKKRSAKHSITIVEKETIPNVLTPPIKGKKLKYSGISSELNQIVNVSSSTKLKPKKRGRSPKIIIPKIEENKPTKEEDTYKKQDTPKKEDIPKKEDEGFKTVERTEDIDETETENVEGVGLIEEFEAEDLEAEEFESEEIEGEELQAYDGTEESTNEERFSDEESDNEEAKEYMRKIYKTYMRIKKERELEEAKRKEEIDDTFTVSAPVVKITPKIIIPDVIKRRIAFDFEMVVNRNQILKFSKKNTIYRLIEDFQNSDPESEENKTIGLMFIRYFNFNIHGQLLYAPEKKIQMRKKALKSLITYLNDGEVYNCSINLYPQKCWHLVYGPSYLIRLFVLLPEIVASLTYSEDIPNVIEMFEVFMKFIAVNFDQYFSDESQDYIVNE
ncbi:nuA4 complex subunit EAF3 homolog [Metopolophium dirhodum]|uniref:nuA4 complex subunit EAF3 homolog n=1 Tax=Metopolophium dirhodum TaxID=44670 RepID=UPI00298F5289|nr:nuA4 complex subunit EAF3 homolog [Metopolophium dirhodum]